MGWRWLGLSACLWGALGVMEFGSVAHAQCADGTHDVKLTDTIYGCAGAWNDPGLVDADGNPVEPSCERKAGNDSAYPTDEEMILAGVSCTPADLCALGWSLCTDEDAPRAAGVSCSELVPAGEVYVGATGSCTESGDSQVVGCGNLGCEASLGDDVCSTLNRTSDSENAEDPCGTLNRSACSEGDTIAAGWSCPPGVDETDPAEAVTKSDPLGGGVLCCFRELCDCYDEELGGCFADGERATDCLVCMHGEVPGVPLTADPSCVDGELPDGGPVEELDLGAEAKDAGSEEPLDLGPAPNGFDAGGDPEITFRGDGGCECRTTSDGAPGLAWALAGLLLFTRRRH